jgi:coenzyme F420-reducing hydrogenase delta subunit/ferredoxin
MSEAITFEPKIVAYVCNWCTYLGADLAGTTRLEYPANVRIVRLPCTGRIDFNLLVKAFEIGADAVMVSGCHPGDCHYTAGNYHARRRWTLFRELLDTLGFDLRRIHFTWISAAEGMKWQQEIIRITAETRQLGPYRYLNRKNEGQIPSRLPGERVPDAASNSSPLPGERVPDGGGRVRAPLPPPPPASPPPANSQMADQETELRAACHKLLTEGAVKVVIGYGAAGPVFIRRAEDVGKLIWNNGCKSNLTAYLKRKEIKRLGKAAIVVKGCDEKSLVILEKESQLDRQALHVIGMACETMGQPKCKSCAVHLPRFANEVIGRADTPPPASPQAGPLDALMKMSPAERMAWWTQEFERCVKCYACRQVCPLCVCERCVAEKTQPQWIESSPHARGNLSWNVTRALHLAGRCVDCGECERFCPVGIPLTLVNRKLQQIVAERYDYKVGEDPGIHAPIGDYRLDDEQEFIK